MYGQLLTVTSLFVCVHITQALWWVFGSSHGMDSAVLCKKSRGLYDRQLNICRREPEVVAEVISGARKSMEECQRQFQQRRWNCSTQGKAMKRTLKSSTRQTGYVQALTAAGVVHSLTEACSQGLLPHCSCIARGRNVHSYGEFVWSGCDDNVKYGYRKSRAFMEGKRGRMRRDIKAMINAHNRQAGRLVVRNHMTRQCKCHGLSGSCSLETCWRRLPSFRDVGYRLRQKYDRASRIGSSNDGKQLIPQTTSNSESLTEEIIYADNSPTFCEPIKKAGSLGTKGRRCNPDSKEEYNCEVLCCGRGYEHSVVVQPMNCACVFRWCCVVQCRTCIVEIQTYRCL